MKYYIYFIQGQNFKKNFDLWVNRNIPLSNQVKKSDNGMTLFHKTATEKDPFLPIIV